MGKIQVLVVDDSSVIRKLVSAILAEDTHIEASGMAANGKIALQKLAQNRFDLVMLDVEMPEMDGLETLGELRKLYPSLPVIMFSTLTEIGASVTLDALALGASDYVTKPGGMGDMKAAMQRIHDELLPKIKALCLDKYQEQSQSSSAVARPTLLAARNKIEILAIGVSTGGPNALGDLLPQLPKEFPVPILIVQHMPPFFTKSLADRLATKSQLTIHEAISGTMLAPGQVWIAPGDFHMTVEKVDGAYQIQTNQQVPENSCRPAVDVLFRSVAKHYGKQSLVTVLTGMGQDGLRGCKEVYDAGGEIYVQDASTSVVWGMPGAVANAGIAHKILPLKQIPGEWMLRLAQGRTR
jgi:two-component system chemotaxis response regulator CheB